MTQEKAGKRKLILIAIIFVILAAAITLILWPYIKKLSEPGTRAAFENWIRGLGLWGVLIMFGLQVLQIVISFIPGEPIEIISGLLYGGFGGMMICLAGCAVASSTVFVLTRKFGNALAKRMPGEDAREQFAFLNNAKRLETIVFLLFLIPGAPKDILTYAIGALSPMKLATFLVLSLPARIPSVVTSTFIGSNMASGNWAAAMIIFAITAIIGLVCIRYKDRIADALKRISRGQR